MSPCPPKVLGSARAQFATVCLTSSARMPQGIAARQGQLSSRSYSFPSRSRPSSLQRRSPGRAPSATPPARPSRKLPSGSLTTHPALSQQPPPTAASTSRLCHPDNTVSPLKLAAASSHIRRRSQSRRTPRPPSSRSPAAPPLRRHRADHQCHRRRAALQRRRQRVAAQQARLQPVASAGRRHHDRRQRRHQLHAAVRHQRPARR